MAFVEDMRQRGLGDDFEDCEHAPRFRRSEGMAFFSTWCLQSR